MTNATTAGLLRWYRHHARRFPWRGRGRRRKPAYAVWVSEIMLQQTRAATVVPYYRRWMKEFPTLRALAGAPTGRVLALWEGLGYYRRAHHLHRAARQLIRTRRGRLPRSADELRALPGIGAYTAAAIASIAFGRDEIALDANLRRVLSRFLEGRVSAPERNGDARLVRRAREMLPSGRAGDFNQALMDLGSEVCTPRAPRCPDCPLSGSCLAFRRSAPIGRQAVPRAERPRRLRVAGIVRNRGRVLILRRPPNGLLAGLWEFPATPPQGSLHSARDGGLRLRLGEVVGTYEQTYSHFHSRVRVHEARLAPRALARTPASQRRWVPIAHLPRFPMGRLDRRIAIDLAARESDR